MFILLLKFADNSAQAGAHMDGHKAWLKRGFDDGSFLLSGSLQPRQGGCILAHNVSREELEQIAQEDPFVAHGVVSPEIMEITPSMAADEMTFLFRQSD